MKYRRSRSLIYFGFVLVAIILVNASLSNDGILGFKLLALNGVTNTDIVCYFKTTTAILDEKNKFIDNDNSPFLIGSPTFTFVAEDGNKIGALNHFAKMRCNTGINTVNPANYQTCLDPTKQETAECQANNGGKLVVKPTTLTVSVYSKDSQNNLIKTFTSPLKTQQTVLELGNEKRLNENGNAVHIPIKSIMEKLDQGVYDSLQEVRITGELQMYYEGFNYPSVTYKLQIPENSAVTYVNLKQIENTIGVVYEDDEVIPGDPADPADPVDSQDKNIALLTDVGKEWFECLIFGDFDCLGQQKFWGIYTVIIIVLAIAFLIDSRMRKQVVPSAF